MLSRPRYRAPTPVLRTEKRSVRGFQLKIDVRINLCYRKSVVSVGFQLKFSLEITYVISGKRKSVVSVGFQLIFSLEIFRL